MKPKSNDLCPVCDCKSLENIAGADAQAQISWIRCDICRQWYHTICLQLSDYSMRQISSFHCSECETEHGPSHMKRQSKRARVNIDYVALDQGETFAVDKSVHPHVPNFLKFEPTANVSSNEQQHVIVLENHELTKEFVIQSGLTKPVIVHNANASSGLKLPSSTEDITVEYIATKTGENESVEVMDVLSQQSESPSWTMRQWRTYFYTPENERDRIRNVISLEVSEVEELGKSFERPRMVSDLDLVDKVWNEDQKRPKVTIYCLMSVRGSYTDFHIDFSGTPVYYTVCHGEKTFLMYPPTPENLELYETWCREPQQNFTWFGDYSRRIRGKAVRPRHGFKVNLKQGDLFVIPSGWIHSVYTPEDAVIIGGNYLTLVDLPMHLTIYGIEKRTKVPSKYRFPMFNRVLWLASWYYYNHMDEFFLDLGISVPSRRTDSKNEFSSDGLSSSPTSQSRLSELHHSAKTGIQLPENDGSKHEDTLNSSTAQFQASHVNEKPKGEVISFDANRANRLSDECGSSRARHVLRSLIQQLSEHYELSKTSPVAKKSIPTNIIGRNVADHLAKLKTWFNSL